MPEWLPLALSGLANIALLGATGLAGAASWRARDLARDSDRQAREERNRVVDLEVELQHAQQRLHQLSDSVNRAEGRFRNAEDNLRLVSRQMDEQGLTASHQLREAEKQRDAVQKRAEALHEERESFRSRAAKLEARLRHAQRLLRSLGIDNVAGGRDPLASQNRFDTRATLRGLQVDCAADAVAIVDDRGLVHLGTGHDAALDRLATTAAMASITQPALAAVLCDAVQSVSVRDSRACRHLLRMDDRLWLAVENQGDLPAFAMRHALLALIGNGAPPAAAPELPDHVIDLDDAPDEEVSAMLERWCQRWRLEAAVVLDASGRPQGATDGAQPGPMMSLRRAVTPMFRRAHRDGFPLDQIVLEARSVREAQVSIRTLRDSLDTPALIALGKVSEPALDEIVATLRWHVPQNNHSAQEA